MSEGLSQQPAVEQIEAANGEFLDDATLQERYGIGIEEASRQVTFTDPTRPDKVYSGTVAQMLTECPLGHMVSLAHQTGGQVGVRYDTLPQMGMSYVDDDPKKN